MTLGFKLIDVDTADKTRLQIGTGDWTYRTDITNFQKAFLADDISTRDTKNFLLFFRYIPEGLLLGLSRRLDGDRGPERSNETLWIFISKNLEISSTRLEDVITASKRALIERTPLRDEESFRQMAPGCLTEDYPERQQPFLTGDMTGTDFAVIECSNHKPSDIISKGFQKAYKDFGFIVLNQSGVMTTDAPKITVDSIRHQVWVNLPKEWPAKLKTTDEVIVTSGNFRIPQKGAYFLEGPYTLTLSRQGYNPVKVKVEVKAGNDYFTFVDPKFESLLWTRKFNTGRLKFINEKGDIIDRNITLSSPDARNESGGINPNFNYGDLIYVAEDRLKDFQLTVAGERYQKTEKRLNLTQPLEPVTLKLRKESEYIEANIGDNHIVVDIKGPDAKMLRNSGIYLKGNNIKRIPQEGLVNTDNKKKHEYASAVPAAKKPEDSLENKLRKSNKFLGISVLSAIVFFIAFVVFLILYLYKDNEEESVASKDNIENVQQASSPAAQPNNSTSQSSGDSSQIDEEAAKAKALKEAVAYLDRDSGKSNRLNVVWEKTYLDNNPVLQGLYDDLNTYNFNAIINTWGPLLKESLNFHAVVDAASKNVRNNWNPAQGPHAPTFNTKPEDVTINALSYRDWLDKDQTPAKPKDTAKPVQKAASNKNGNNSQQTDTGKSKDKIN